MLSKPKKTIKTIRFKPPKKIKCDGTSIWMPTRGLIIKVVEIKFEIDKYELPFIWVTHSGPWHIYTDDGFEKEISKLLSQKMRKKVKVQFTEQGMQEDYLASMEPANSTSDKIIANFIKANKKDK